MKKLYCILLLILPLVSHAQQIVVSGAGYANYGSVNLDGTYTLGGTTNGKNSYTKSLGYDANGCQNCSGTATIFYDGTQWVLSASGGGYCWYCQFSSSSLRTNTTTTTLNPPCSGWPDGMTVAGNCEGGALSDFGLSSTSVCQGQNLVLNWTNNVTLGTDNVFIATLSNQYGSFESGTTTLASLTSTLATSMIVTIPATVASSTNYKIKLEASKAPESLFTTFSPTLIIGSDGEPSINGNTRYVCAGQSVTLQTTSSYEAYQWYKNDVVISGAISQSYTIASVTEADDAYYSVVGVLADGCRTRRSESEHLSVTTSPQIYSHPVGYLLCQGNTTDSLRIWMYEAGTFTYTWKKGAETVKTETVTSNTNAYVPVGGWQATDAGTYTVIVSQLGCTNTSTSYGTNVRVEQPIPTITLSPSGTVAAPVTLTATAGFSQYIIYKRNESSYDYYSTSYSNTILFNQSGKFVVKGYNSCGISENSNEVTITTVCDTPPTLSASSTTSVPTTLTASAGFIGYYWYLWNGSSYSYIAYTTSNTRNVSNYGQYAVRGNASCGITDYSALITISNSCASDADPPIITSAPTSVNVACGTAASWDVTASDNCTDTGAITYRHYISTGTILIGDPYNLLDGTGSGTTFTTDVVVHVFAFDANNNQSTEHQIAVTVSSDAYQFSTLSASQVCEGNPAVISVTLPDLAEGTQVDVTYQVDGESSQTAIATVDASHVATFQTVNLVADKNGKLVTISRIQDHLSTGCGKDLASANTVTLTVTACSVDTPIAWYPFNGNADDAVGTLHGAVNGATLTTDRFGNQNAAYLFDGIDDIIQTADEATTITDNWTLSAWIKPAVVAQNGAIVSNGYDNTVDYGNGYSIVLNDANGNNGNTVTGNFSGAGWYDSGTTLTEPDKWYHIVFTRKDGVSTMYVNGVAAPNTSGTTPFTPDGSVLIGAQNGGRYFNGAIDEVKIFAVGLTAEQVMQQYQATKPYPDLVLTLQVSPALVAGQANVLVMVNVFDLGAEPTTGEIKVRIAKQSQLAFTLPNVTQVGGKTVQNSDWKIIEDDTQYILTTNNVLVSGGMLSFGLEGQLNPGNTSGSLAISATLEGGGEVKVTNNSDADLLDYFSR